jgi:hydrogenase/urease accessory protein HupE
MNFSRLWFTTIFGLVLVARAFAHDPGFSSANVARTETGLKVPLTFAWAELAGLGPAADGPTTGAGNEEPPAEFETEWSKSAERFVQVYAGGALQPAMAPSLARSALEPGDVTVTFEWAGVPATPVTVEFPVLQELQYGHRMVLTIGEDTVPVALLRERLAKWEIPEPAVSTIQLQSGVALPSAAAAATEREGWSGFLRLGVEHILIGFDHLCFLLALLLAAVRMRDVVALITTFTLAHSLTLAAAALGIVALSPRLVEPLIAASIVYVAVENLILQRPPRYRLLVVFGFGLVHGLGFAGILAERLPGVTGWAVVPPLLAFNAGVELGQLAVAACLVPLIRLARAQPRLAPRLQPVLSAVIATAGIVWFFQRV